MQTLPTNPTEFKAFMERMWEAYECGSTSEGMEILLSTDFDQYSDARLTAIMCGMRRTGGSSRDGDPGGIYRFPNGDGVWIAWDGGGVAIDVSKYGRRQRPFGVEYKPRQTVQ